MSDQQLFDPIIEEALKEVNYPGFNQDIVAMGLVLEAKLENGKATIRMRPVAAPPEVREGLEDVIAAKIGALPGVKELELHIPEPPQPKAQKPKGPQAIPGVKTVVPVASGKGGVGKSTVSVNLAMAMAERGLKVGLLDLDLYGPSIPIMLGMQGAQPEAGEGGKMLPIQKNGLKVLSIGFLIGADKALIWRGPLIMKAVRQLLHDSDWGELDVLVLDLPPGTGDVQITMAQEVPVTGAVVVTTPQDVALADAIRAVDMFRQIGSGIIGIVENMSFFICPDCGGRHEIFGHGSVEPLCAKLGVPFLGELPLDMAVPKMADNGLAAVQNASSADAYEAVAEKVAKELELI